MTKRFNIFPDMPVFKTTLRFLILLILLAGSTVNVSLAQSKGNIKGTLLDSGDKTVLPKATVVAVNQSDSSLIAYTLTDKSGGFLLQNLPSDRPVNLIISYVAYESLIRSINLDKGRTEDMGQVFLQKKPVSLGEVTVKGERTPVVVKKDTIEFAAEAFKVRPNALVEELLNKLPGLQINSDGSILVNGKSVKKLMINGHEYFSNDLRIATRNFDAVIIDKIQIYDDRENDPDHLIDESKVDKIINLKLKKKYRKSVLGRVYGGAGTKERYETGLILNSLRDTFQVSLIGYSNNLSQTAFSKDDLSSLGGFNRSGSDQLSNGNISTGGKTSDGIETVSAGGFNINQDYGKKLKINLLGFASKVVDRYETKSLNENFLNDSSLFTNQFDQRKLFQTKYNISSLVQWNSVSGIQIKYAPHYLYSTNGTDQYLSSQQTTASDILLSSQNDSLNNRFNTKQFDHSLSFYKKISKNGGSVSFINKLQAGSGFYNNILNNKLTVFAGQDNNDPINQLISQHKREFVSNTDLTYRQPFGKILIGSLTMSNSYSDATLNTGAFGRNPLLGYSDPINDQSAGLNRVYHINTVAPKLTFNLSENVSLSAEVGAQWQKIRISALGSLPPERNFFFALPSLTLNGEYYSLNYSKTISQPTLSDLSPALIKANSYSAFLGNPNLRPAETHTLSFNIYKFGMQNQSSLLIYVLGTINHNAVYYRSELNAVGVRTITPYNGEDTHMAFLGVNYNRRVTRTDSWNVTMKSSLNQGYRDNVVSINSEMGKLRYYYIIAAAEFSLNYKDLFFLNPRYELSPSFSSYSGLPYGDVNSVNNRLIVKYNFNLNNFLAIEGDYSFVHNPLLNSNFRRSVSLLNSAVNFRLNKGKAGLFKLSAFDLLNQNLSIFRTTSPTSVLQGENLIQNRYFMLTYQYKLNLLRSSAKN